MRDDVSGLLPNFASRKVIYVSKGTAATDTRTGLNKYDANRPFATLNAAQSAAASGDLIVVEPGTYNEGNLGKNGVDWYFQKGASVEYSADTRYAIFGDGSTNLVAGSAMNYSVTGYGRFVRTGAVGLGNGASVFYIRTNCTILFEFDYAARGELTQNGAATFHQRHGTVVYRGRYATSSNDAGGTFATYEDAVKATIEVSLIESQTYDALICGAGEMIVSSAAVVGSSGTCNAVEITGGVFRGKLLTIESAGEDGTINSYGDGATAYFDLCDITSTCTTPATAMINGQNELNRIHFNGCTIRANENYDSLPAVESFEAGGITLKNTKVINTAGVCVANESGSMIIDGCVLVAGSSSNSVTSASPSTDLKTWNSFANRNVSANVNQLVSTIQVDTDIE